MARRELRGVREVAAERSRLSSGARRQAALRRRRREDRRWAIFSPTGAPAAADV